MNVDEEIFLSAYIDGELTPGQRLRVESALVSDPRLAEDLRALTAVRDLVTGLSRPGLTLDVASAVVARLDRRGRAGPLALRLAAAPASRGARAAALATAAAALVAVATLGLVGTRQDKGGGPPRPVGVTHRVTDRGPTHSPTGPDPADVVDAGEDPHVLAPGRDEHHQELQHQHVRAWLDSPTLRKLFIVTDAMGDADREVVKIIDETPRRQPSYGRIVLTQGIVMDPDHPGRAVVFALVMDDRELKEFQESLDKSFRDSLEETTPRPEFVTQLADVGQMAVHSGRNVARLISPESREHSRARRTNIGKEHLTKARLLPENPGFGPFQAKGLDLEDELIVNDQEGPTPEQMRSRPHRSLRPTPEAPGPPPLEGGEVRTAAAGTSTRPENRGSQPPGSVVLVMVTRPSRGGRGTR